MQLCLHRFWFCIYLLPELGKKYRYIEYCRNQVFFSHYFEFTSLYFRYKSHRTLHTTMMRWWMFFFAQPNLIEYPDRDCRYLEMFIRKCLWLRWLLSLPILCVHCTQYMRCCSPSRKTIQNAFGSVLKNGFGKSANRREIHNNGWVTTTWMCKIVMQMDDCNGLN